MKNRPFTDKTQQPDSNAITKALGSNAGHYKQLAALTAAYKTAWTFSSSGGWLQKIHDGKKALLYIIPEHGYFTISLTVREQEKVALLADDALSVLHHLLSTAPKAPEGFHLLIEVKSEETCHTAMAFMQELVLLRQGKK